MNDRASKLKNEIDKEKAVTQEQTKKQNELQQIISDMGRKTDMNEK